MVQLIRLKLRAASEEGFLVTLTSSCQQLEIDGFIPYLPQNLREAFQEWQDNYRQSETIERYFTKVDRDNPNLRIAPKSVTAFSQAETVDRLKKELNSWLNSYHPEWQKIRETLIALADRLHREHFTDIQFILDTNTTNLYRFPWQEWDLLAEYYPHAEIALAMTNNTVTKTPLVKPERNEKNTKVRILAVFGDSYNLNTNADLEILDRLHQNNAEIVFLERPDSKELCQKLWEDRGYHIFIFIGHSSSREDGKIGWIQINERENLTIESFKNSLKQAINKGMQLAIFNSCDGLGLASQLAELNLPQSIVMREPIPDEVAIEFLAYFFQAFTSNKSLFASLHAAKKRLEPFHLKYPGSPWLPVLCVQPSTNIFTWQKSDRDSLSNIARLSQSKLKIIAIAFSILLSFLIGIGSQSFLPSLAQIIHLNNYSTIASVQNLPLGNWQYGGSTTWQPIRDSIDKKIVKKHPQFRLIYTEHPLLPSSSGMGLEMLLDDRISFVQSSRPISENEYRIARQRGSILKQIPIAIDSLAIAVNPNLNIKSLTLEQLKNIYNGSLTNWQQLGGEDISIVPYSRPFESGTTEFFRQNILGNKDFSNRVIFIDNKKQIAQNISLPENKGAIYFASATEIVNNCQLKPLAISRYSTTSFVAPYRGELKSSESCRQQSDRLNLEAIEDGSYPLTRRLFVITSANNYIEVKVGESYANLLLTDEGQDLIKKAGFIPLKSSRS
jgi:ABC-type phosphate transport system substrate-binding protein